MKIVLVGDSTVTDDSGWGAGFKACLADGVLCVNLAQNGRSSKSYRAEGWWDKVLDERGDYVFIQFGHNDQPGKGPERETRADTEFVQNMNRYVIEARSTGSTPVLLTSLTRRNFDGDGRIILSLDDYVRATRKVAAQQQAPLIELHDKSVTLAERLGAAGCAALSKPREDPKDLTPDTTHLNVQGSLTFGAIVAGEVVRVIPQLAAYITFEQRASSY